MGKRLKKIFLAITRKVKAAGSFILKQAARFIGFMKSNPKEAAVVLTAGGYVSRMCIKELSMKAKERKLKKEEDVKRSRIYDPSERHYWILKRPLINSEWEEVLARKENGESLHQALYKMGVLL